MVQLALCLLLAIFASAASGNQAVPADRTVVDLLLRTAPGLKDAAIVQRLGVSERLDLVLAIGWPRKVERVAKSEYPWSPQDRIGLFLQDRMNAGLVFQLAVEAGPQEDSFLRVERMTATELVLSCFGEKWSNYDNRKFLYDIRARALVKDFSYAPFRTDQVVPGPRGPQLVMADGQRMLLVEVDSAVPHIVPDAEARRALSKIPMEESSAGNQTFHTPAAVPEAALAFGPGKRFQLSREKNRFGSEFPVIVELRGQQGKSFQLAQSDVKTWRQARPDNVVESRLVPDPAEMNEQIGPHQVEGDRLWFGKTFYNGEGMTGVGGFGYFDAATRAWQIYSPVEIRRWSVSAMLVEADSIWLALYHRGEYGNTSGGLVRWDRRTEQTEMIDPRVSASIIVRCGEALCLGAGGISVLKDRQLRSYFVDRTSDGRYRMELRENIP